MDSATVWGKLETSFDQGAITVEVSSTKQLFSPGVAGLQVMIESEFGSGRVATEDITNFYDTNDWDQNRCISWEELRTIVLSLSFPELEFKNEVEDGKEKEDENTDNEDKKISCLTVLISWKSERNLWSFLLFCLRS